MHANWLAVLVAAIATMIVGFIWYSNPMFGKAWMRVIGVDPSDKEQVEKIQKAAGPLYGFMFIGSLVAAYVLSIFISGLGAMGASGGMKVAFWVWLGFIATVKFGDALFSGKTPSIRKTMFWTGAGFQLASFLAMGAILGAWK